MSKYSIPLNNLDSELFIPIPLVPVWPQTCGMTWIPETEKSLGHHFNSLSSQPFPFSSCCSVSRSCPTLGNPMDCGTPGSFVFCCLPEFAQIHIHWVSVLSNHFILCHPLLRLPSVFLSIFISEVVNISPTTLIPACDSSSQAFHVMNSAYKLNKKGDRIQPWRTSSPIWNQSVVPWLVLTVASWPAYSFLRQIRWSGIPISLRIFQFVVPHSQSVVSEAEN